MKDPDDGLTGELPGVPPTAGDYLMLEEERRRLRGVGLVAIALYVSALKGNTDATGRVVGATARAFVDALAPRQSRKGGPRLVEPTKQNVRDALDRLEAAGLLRIDRAAAMREGRLHLVLIYPGRLGAGG